MTQGPPGLSGRPLLLPRFPAWFDPVHRLCFGGLVPGRPILRFLLLLLVLWWPAPAPAETLRVAAAANLKPLLATLVPAFEAARPGDRVVVTYGASGKLQALIAQGAPFDLFLSADARRPAALAQAGRTRGEPFVYALGVLVVWTPADAPAPDPARPLAVLGHPAVRRVALPNPAVAPYGAAARATLTRAGLWEGLAGKRVLGENASQTAHFAYVGAAQAALLPLSLAQAPPLATAGRHAVIPADRHPPIRQAGVVLRGPREEVARAFAGFLLGDTGRRRVAAAGYRAP